MSPQLPFILDTSSKLSGVAPKKKLKLATLVLLAISNFASNNSLVIVAGFVFGISKKEVIPPATAALEPLSIVSLCVSPGSLKCTCGSIPPGII